MTERPQFHERTPYSLQESRAEQSLCIVEQDIASARPDTGSIQYLRNAIESEIAYGASAFEVSIGRRYLNRRCQRSELF